MAKSFLASKTFWVVVLTFAMNGLGSITGMIADHPTLAVAVNAVMAVLTILSRAVASGPLTISGK